MPRGTTNPYPATTVVDAALVADAIRSNNAGHPMNRLLLAEAMTLKPTSSRFRALLTASGQYGFTKGSYTAENILLTDLGEQLTKPRSEGERLEAMRQGMRNIALFEQLLRHYNNNSVPSVEFLRNTLEREPFNVTPELAREAAELFTQNGVELGFIRSISGTPHVILEAGPPTAAVQDSSDRADSVGGPAVDSQPAEQAARASEYSHIIRTDADGDAQIDKAVLAGPSPTSPTVASTPPENRQFFIAHGWDEDALEQVQVILRKFGIPYVVAREEANAGRPISQKIKELMKSCSAGIFIFSADEEFKDKDGNVIWRPRENVIFELGAGSLEYEQRIVILKETSVYFPTDFRDIGYIEYEKGNLQAKAMDLLSELIAFGAVRVVT